MNETRGVVSDPVFLALTDKVTGWIAACHDARDDPLRLLEEQARLAGQLFTLQDRVRELRAHLESTTESSRKQAVTKEIAANKKLMRIVRDVGDGVAWRALRYQRAMLRQLAAKPPTGWLQRDSFEREVEEALRYQRATGNLVILNDLTNFLRYGDYTGVSDDVVEFAEVKSSRSGTKGSKAKQQRQKLKLKAETLDKGLGVAADGSTVPIRSAARASTHTERVREALRIARTGGFATVVLSPRLVADALCPLVSVQAGKELTLSNAFHDSTWVQMFHNYLFFHRWIANVAPYSVFPFDFADRAGLLTGRSLLVSYLDFDRFVTHLRDEYGFVVELPTDEEMAPLVALRPGEVAKHELDAPVRISRPDEPFRLSVPFTLLARITAEFVTEESLISQIATLIRYADQPTMLLSQFSNEEDLWD